MKRNKGGLLELTVNDIDVGPTQDGYHPVKLATSRGEIDYRYYAVRGAKKAALWVGGVGGGWDTPAKGLYPRLCKELKNEGIASLRVKLRHPTDLAESVLDVLAGVAFLEESEGIEALALTGYSFGGAVVIQAAAASHIARTVVTLATQSYGAAPASHLGPRCSILLVHGALDSVLSLANSEMIFNQAQEPKQLVTFEGAHHGLDGVAEEVHHTVYDWIVAELNKDA